MKKLTILPVFVILLALAGCNTDFSASNHSGAANARRSLSTLEKEVATSGNRFGCTLFQNMVTDQPDSNIFISPLSVSMALGMAFNGANGATADSMRQTLAYGGLSLDDINASYKSLVELLTGLDPLVRMQIANSIWYRLGFAVLPDFLQVNQTYFDAEVRELDFALPESVDIINGWVEDKTNGLIDEIIEFIHPATVMFLINAVYFKADWTWAFDEEDTFDGSFTLPDNRRVDCKMMMQHNELDYFENGLFQAVDLPYGDGRFSMTLFLPNSGHDVDVIVQQFTPENWNAWTGQLAETELILAMPRFKIAYERKLNDVLKAMGMGLAFSQLADFTKITADGGIYIHQVRHKSFIEVNEEGTEAAAVTIVEFRETSAGPSMTLDRPFFFTIRETTSNTLIFMGKVVNPVETE